MDKFEGSSQLLTGEARGGDNGVIVVGLSSEPQIVEAFFDSWDGSDEYDHDAFVNELMQRDLMLLDLQACFIGIVPGVPMHDWRQSSWINCAAKSSMSC